MQPQLIRHFTALVMVLAVCVTGNVSAVDANKATLETGKKLVSEAKCEACHAGKIGGDGSAIYTRKDRRVTVRSKLLPQVERCNSGLGLGLFPEDEVAIAAYLNATHYQFKD